MGRPRNKLIDNLASFSRQELIEKYKNKKLEWTNSTGDFILIQDFTTKDLRAKIKTLLVNSKEVIGTYKNDLYLTIREILNMELNSRIFGQSKVFIDSNLEANIISNTKKN